MSLGLLPEEVLEEIVNHLVVKDLLACSAVNSEWREKLNCDIFWKRFCVSSITNYLEDTPCEVSPHFTPPDDYGERLEPLCDWRIRYMKTVHLMNNWKTHQISSCEFRSRDGIISSEVQIDCDKIHWLFLKTKSEIEIWNITNHPQYYGSVSLFPESLFACICIVGKTAVVKQWNVVTVYDLSVKENFKSLFSFALEEDKPLPSVIEDSSDGKENNFINKIDDFRFASFGSLIVGYKRIPNHRDKVPIHIWSTSLKEKIKTEYIFDYLKNQCEVAFMNIFKIDEVKGLTRVVFHSLENKLCSQINVYDFRKLTFDETNITFVGVAVWCGCAKDIIVTFSSNPGGLLQFHNYSSGNLLSKKEIGEYTNSDQIQVVNSFLLYCTFNCMNVLDILKQEVVYCLQFSFYSFVRRITVIEPRFVIVWLLERGTGPGYPSYYQEVWDVTDFSSKRFECSSDHGLELLTHSPSIIKQVLIVNNNLSVYTYW